MNVVRKDQKTRIKDITGIGFGFMKTIIVFSNCLSVSGSF